MYKVDQHALLKLENTFSARQPISGKRFRTKEYGGMHKSSRIFKCLFSWFSCRGIISVTCTKWVSAIETVSKVQNTL